MARVIKAPARFDDQPGSFLFLAGSIDMGRASDWQDELSEALAEQDVVLLNPRRDDWDSSWEQTISNPQFREQVEWELSGLERADLVVMFLEPKSKSPVSLLELGLQARAGKMIVCCPEGFWRKGNVDIVCDRYGIERVDTLSELIATVKVKLQAYSSRI